MDKNVIYLDNNATTSMAPEVMDAMLPYFTSFYGNPSSIHSFGGQVHKKIEDARESLAALLNCYSDELAFTSCGTESDNAVIAGSLKMNSFRKKIITTQVEHPAIMGPCKKLQSMGYFVEYCPVDHMGRLRLDILSDIIDDTTALVSTMWANNETGTIFPVHEIAEIAHRHGALFHTDAVQAVGKIPIDLKESNIDFLSLSGHKFHAPKGIGALYIKRHTKFNPFMLGGHQEKGLRAGTENVPGIIAIGKAAELAAEHIKNSLNNMAELRDELEQKLIKVCPDARVNGDKERRVPNTTNISFEYIEGESILMMLNAHGIAASSGSACTTGSLEPSHVLRAMNVPYTAAHGSIRFSLSRYTSKEEINKVIDVTPSIVKRLREISPYGK